MITYQNKVRKNAWIAWVLLSAGLIGTIYAFVSVAMNIDAEAKAEALAFCNDEFNDVMKKTEERVDDDN